MRYINIKIDKQIDGKIDKIDKYVVKKVRYIDIMNR